MKNLSLKLDDQIFLETERILEGLKKPRNTYINEAIEFYNRHQRRVWLEKQFAYEAEMGREDALEMLKEMENLDPHLLDEYKED